MYLINATSGDLIAGRVRPVRGPFARMVGLLTRGAVPPDEGIWLAGCPAVHTIGMRATIDLIFLDGDDRVVGIAPQARPNRPFYSCRGAKSVVELGAGSRLELVRTGDILELAAADPRPG
jgi:uncharacterized membrane protein (UPF0127 family)